MLEIHLILDKVTAILGGLIFYETGSKTNGILSFDQNSVNLVSIALFYTTLSISLTSFLAAVMSFPLELPIYYREHDDSVYRSDCYYLSKVISEVIKIYYK